MEKIKTASGKVFRQPALVSRSLPLAMDPNAMVGAVVLGVDGHAYQSLQVSGSNAYRWCRLIAADPVVGWIETPAVVAGEAARSVDEPGLILRIKDDAFANEVYAIGTPGQQDFGLGAVPPANLPEGYLPLDGTVYGGRNYATYVYVPSDGSSAEMLPGLGSSFVLKRFAIGQEVPYMPGSLLMNPQAGVSGTVGRQGRVQHHGAPEVASLDEVDAGSVPGLQVRTPTGRVYQSQRWAGRGAYRWGLMAGVDPSTGGLDLPGGLGLTAALDAAALTIGTAGQAGFGMGCMAPEDQPIDVAAAGSTWSIRSQPDFGNYVFPAADGDIGLLSTAIVVTTERVNVGESSRYRVGSTSIHPDTGVFWTVGTDGLWAKQSSL
jgi:hypothetical protein